MTSGPWGEKATRRFEEDGAAASGEKSWTSFGGEAERQIDRLAHYTNIVGDAELHASLMRQPRPERVAEAGHLARPGRVERAAGAVRDARRRREALASFFSLARAAPRRRRRLHF